MEMEDYSRSRAKVDWKVVHQEEKKRRCFWWAFVLNIAMILVFVEAAGNFPNIGDKAYMMTILMFIPAMINGIFFFPLSNLNRAAKIGCTILSWIEFSWCVLLIGTSIRVLPAQANMYIAAIIAGVTLLGSMNIIGDFIKYYLNAFKKSEGKPE